MVKAVYLISVLVLGLTWTLQVVPDQDVDTLKPFVAPEGEDSASNEVTLSIGNATEFNEGACSAAPEIGPCRVYTERHFYNSTSMSCKVFTYGGCEGNQNNFKDEKDCLEGCHIEEVCKAAPKTGPCKAHVRRYFFNSTSMRCEKFIYGGCGGNPNNFKNQKDCLERCHTEAVCKAAPKTGPCKAYFPRYFYNSTSMTCENFIYGGCGGNQNNFKNKKQCLERCHTDG